MVERFKIRNRAHEPSRSRRLADFTSHPEIGGRVLAPRATRFIPRAELTARILDDVDKYRACDVVSFQREFGPPSEVDTNELRAALGIQALAPIPAYASRGSTTAMLHVDEVAHFAPPETASLLDVAADYVARAKGPEEIAAAAELVRLTAEYEEAFDAAQKTLAEEHRAPLDLLAPDGIRGAPVDAADAEAPSLTDTLLADITAPEGSTADVGQLYTEESLAALKGTELDEILVGTFGEDPKQLYKIGAKAKKVAHILKLQADARG